MNTTLLTGSSGFIGRHLAAKLGEHTPIPHHQICDWPVRVGDNVFFLSTYGNMANHRDIGAILQANVVDVLAMVRKIHALPGHAHLIYVSSSSVTLPVQTPYSMTKRAAEKIILASGIRACIVRLYSVTGRGEQESHLIPKLIHSCLNQKPMDLVLDATHDYVDVEDVCDGLIALANNRATGVFEFGNGKAISNLEVAATVEKVCGRIAKVNAVPSMRSYDNPNWHCSSAEMDKAIAAGWKPRKSLETSIREMVEHRA